MPALTSYSPYETLVFFQNIAQYGSDRSSLQEISASLTHDQLIRESNDYDAEKFSPDALQHLYNRIVNAHSNGKEISVDGPTALSDLNPLKRKLSASPPPNLKHDHDTIVAQFVDRLYAQFKAETIRELRKQEQEYEHLQRQIAQVEDQIKAEEAEQSQIAGPVKDDAQTIAQPEPRADPVSAQLQANLEAVKHEAKPVDQTQREAQPLQVLVPLLQDRAQPSPVPISRTATPRSASGTPLPRSAQPAPLPQPPQLPSPVAFNRTLPSPSPQRSTYGPLPPSAHGYPPHQQSHGPPPMLPPIHSLQRLPSHEGYSSHQRPSSQGRASPLPAHPQQQYAQYPPYQQPSPHGWPSPAPQQYPLQQYQPPPQHYQPPPPQGRYPQVQTPNQPPYQPYPHTAPVPFAGQQQWRGPPYPPYHQYPASASTTPIPRPLSRPMVRSGSSTPWKERSTPISFRARSPSRLVREVSPLSDHDSPPPESPRRRVGRPPKQDTALRKSLPRDTSATPAASLSRAQSVVSNASEAPNPPKRRVGRPPKVKPEPSTPAPTTSDSEQQQRSSSRRGRPRTSISTNVLDIPRSTTATKRKRDAPSSSPAARARSISNAQIPATSKVAAQYADPNFVVVSKTFGKTSQLLLNEIMSHKLAGIFAKPLTERDAPGYKSLIHRPQDLKTLKAAITKGSKAAIATIDELESMNTHDNDMDGATPTPAPKLPQSGSSTGERSLGNGFYLVLATDDLVPPKGIVNSSQLEMELVRMFANAVMFNPLPASERGLGRSLRLRKRGGKLLTQGASHILGRGDDDNDEADPSEREQSEVAATSESGSSSLSSGLDETGIIADAREMFEDVEKLVARWRELEGEKIGSAQGIGQSERHASVSVESAAGEDGNEVDTPTAGVPGGTRKRRKVGDH